MADADAIPSKYFEQPNPIDSNLADIAKAITIPRPASPQQEERHNQHKYWVGLTKDCPFTTITAGGQDFNKHVEPPVELEEGNWQRQLRKGQLVTLGDDQIKKILEKIKVKYIRVIGGGSNRKALLFSTENIQYRWVAGDEPLAKYVYIMRVPDKSPNDWRPGIEPTPLLKD